MRLALLIAGLLCFALWWAYYHEWREAKRLRASLETVCAAKVIAHQEDRERILAACLGH